MVFSGVDEYIIMWVVLHGTQQYVLCDITCRDQRDDGAEDKCVGANIICVVLVWCLHVRHHRVERSDSLWDRSATNEPPPSIRLYRSRFGATRRAIKHTQTHGVRRIRGGRK